MNDAIVKNINNVVRENDILIHLGDWSFKGIDNIFEFRSRINCQTIHLILGNHDKFIKFDKNDCSKLFSSIQHIQTFKIDDFCFVASHYPIQSWENLKLGWSHLHGHMHYSPTNKLGFGRKMDIGIDGHIEFRPYNIVNEIMPIMNEREIDTHLKNDHHLNNVLNNN
jgi:calcineurin-like phosphoesterase family protein